MKLKKIGASILSLGLASAACSDSAKREWHVDGLDAGAEQRDAEARRLHDMQKIKVFLPEGGPNGTGAYEDWDSTQLRQVVKALCELRHDCSVASATTYTCGDAFARTKSDLSAETCAAETMHEIANAAVAPVELKHVGATWHYVIPPQSEPARLAMLREVRYFANRVTYKAYSALDSHIYGGAGVFGEDHQHVSHRYNDNYELPSACDFATYAATIKTTKSIPKFYPDDGSRVNDTRMFAEVLVKAFEAGERLMRDATFAAVDKTLAVAEWDRGSTESLVLAQQRTFSRALVSRAAAAHLLVGGPEGLRLDTVRDSTGLIPESDAFCSSAPLTGSGKRALAALREAGVSPDVVSNAGSSGTGTDALANGDIPSGSVRQRLTQIRGKAISSIYSEFGLTLNDFKEARDYLKQELRAFARSRTAVLGKAGTYDLYAATSTEAPDRGTGYYSAIARQQAFSSRTYDEQAGWIRLDEVPELSRYYQLLHDGTLGVLNAVLASSNLTAEASAALRPLFLLSQRVESEIDAVVKVRTGGSAWYGASSTDVEVWTRRKLDDIALYAGEDDVACVLTGNVEGAPCTATKLPNTQYALPANQRITQFAGGYLARIAYLAGTGASSLGKRVYIVGTTGTEKFPLGSIPAVNTTEPNQDANVATYALMPAIEGKVREVLRPSRAFCSRAAVECNGDLFDERIPLENELTTDSDSLENSWKHYLDRAEAAAKEADALGEAYVNANIQAEHQKIEQQQFELQVRDKAEQELEVVQQVCGVNADADTILKLFGQTGNLETLTDVQCTDDTSCLKAGETAPTQLRQCIGGRCVTVPTRLLGSQDIDTVSSRLAECLGADRIIPRVVMGNRAVCVHNSSDACGTDLYCPRVVPDGQDPATFCGQLQAWNSLTWTPIVDKMGFYDVRPIADFSRKKVYVKTEVFSCQQQRLVPWLDIGWARRDAYGPWVSTSGTYKECDSRTSLPLAEQMANHGYDPALYTTNKAQWVFPEGGAGIEILSCPEDFKVSDLASLTVPEQLWVTQQVTQCRAEQLSQKMGTRILSNVPSGVLDVLREHGPQGIFPKFGGSYGEKLADFRSVLVGYGENTRHIGEELNGVATDIGNYKLQVEALGLAGDQLNLSAQELELEREINNCRLQQIEAKEDGAIFGTICKIGAIAAGAAATVATGGAAAPALVLAASANGMGALGSLGTDLDSLGQDKRIIETQNRILDLKKKGIDVSKAQLKVQQAQELIGTREAIRRRGSAILSYAVDSQAKTELFDGKLADLETERDKARRALSRAIAASAPQQRISEQKLVQLTSNNAELQRRRYEMAFKNATRLAFLAKRAIEQRLGLRFAELTQRLPLLDAPPAVWENEICVASGLDYKAMQESQTLPDGALQGFIGAYVAKLRNVVDAYQLQYAFHEGQDLMTVSMKEDLFRGDATCTGPSKNLLKESSELGVAERAPDSTLANNGPGTVRRLLASTNWVPFGCAAGTVCLWPTENALTLGKGADLAASKPMVIYGSASGRLQQPVALTPGTHVLSWYETGRQNGADVRLVGSNNAVIAHASTAVYDSHLEGTTSWVRYTKRFEIATAGTYKVDILPSTHVATAFGWISIGAPMLERIDSTAVGPVATTYESTDASGLRSVPCPDADGEVFRNKYWTYDCQRICPQGTNSSCSEATTLERCFHETTFSLKQVDIESGRTLKSTGFAFGNFNYRIDQVAVNVVGNARQCAAGSGSSCFAAGYVPYSIAQRGPFMVRNHTGRDVPVTLFDGRIESAKALAAERYLTNPLNSADADLIGGYLRNELQGRPLDANYVVRIWDDEGFNFDAVKDVQLLVKYRYWTSAE